jgi:hypothetical protein
VLESVYIKKEVPVERTKDGAEGRAAFLAKFDNPDDLAEHMRDLALKRGLYSRVGKAVVKTYESVMEAAPDR